MATESQIAANQANAQKSTGPQTPEGKAISAKNNARHGFAGFFNVMPWEDVHTYQVFLLELRHELKAKTVLEIELSDAMAQHRWLVKRALHLQEQCFTDKIDCDREQKLALYLRYQTAHERAFHKAMAAYLKLKEQKQKSEIGFESQKRKAEEHTRKQERHEMQKAHHEYSLLERELACEMQLIEKIGRDLDLRKDPDKKSRYNQEAARLGLESAA